MSTSDVSAPATQVTVSAARRRAIYAGAIGNFIEWYDFGLYGFFAVTISALFFPAADPTAALLSTFAVFALGFFVRPFGAFVFGWIGDRIGRRAALLSAVILMSLSTVLLGVLPTHASIGVWATVLLVVLRLFQGLSAGGEYAGSTIYVVEHAPRGWRGRYGSLSPAAVGIGTATAAIVSLVVTSSVSEADLASWGWRIPFLLSGPLGIIAIFLRMRIEETPEFKAVRDSGQVVSAPLAEGFRVAKKSMATVFGWNMLNGVSFYMLTGFTVSYMMKVAELSYTAALTALAISLLFYTSVSPIYGLCVDKIGRRPVAMFSSLGTAIIAPLSFYLLHQQTFTASLLALMGIAFFAAGVTSIVAVSMVDLFPARIRFSAGAVPYQLSIAIFGGTAPYVATWLGGTDVELAPGYYLSIISVIAAIVAWFGFKGITENSNAELVATAAAENTQK
ncbi:MFS transporter [Rhodococcus sp. IEGM 1366]|uniref:MFS transporter n=1 Tax=Rhodococcus sp. IEGM 1366 TaxID=3082223 RepID=UPI0029551AFA|nr:MFS transporter [Rhodococcus sp. IEGM 1366]MDV8070904.1 MFS transporter [Rhodococcus sp. IEGM 1366]